MLQTVGSMGLVGLQAYPVSIEADVSTGMPVFEVVGLPDAAVRESRERVRAALKNCGYTFPAHKITINLAPADVKKSGPLYDLPILLGILQASEQLSLCLDGFCFVGELSLGGEVRRCTGVLPMAIEAAKRGIRKMVVPRENALEASVVEGIEIYGVSHLRQLLDFLKGAAPLAPTVYTPQAAAERELLPDLADVKGQQAAKRALEIAAAGGHNLLLIGPPGSGKSMLAKRIPGILPRLSFEEAIETTNIHSIAGLLAPEHPLLTERPFRAPHHTISAVGLSGGGTPARPGEVSLAHNGVLFLDELPEFKRDAKEVLRQPMEDGQISITRSQTSVTYPCSVMVVAAMNPCPCGYYGDARRRCSCTARQVSAYLSKVSGPLLDRLDLHVNVEQPDFDELAGGRPEESSAAVRARVEQARALQRRRYRGLPFCTNARLTSAEMARFCPMTDSARATLKQAYERLGLSGRGYDRLLKVARTVADLAGADTIDSAHIFEAIQFRSLDRKYWGN